MSAARGAVRLREEPLFCWIRLGPDGQPVDDVHKHELLTGRRLTVARAAVRQCKLRGRLSVAERLAARPSTQPYIESGRTQPVWMVVREGGDVPLADLCEFSTGGGGVAFRRVESPGIEEALVEVETTSAASITLSDRSVYLTPADVDIYADVDTTCARFRVAPCYWARIEGPRLVTVEDDGEPIVVGYLDALVRIEDARPNGFTVHLAPLAAIYSESFPESALCQILQWTIVWMGVE